MILCDTRGALLQLQNTDRGTSLALDVANKCCDVDEAEWNLCLQWVPSHCGIPGNERADALAATARSEDSSINVDRFVEVHQIITDSARLSHPDDRIAQGCSPPVP